MASLIWIIPLDLALLVLWASFAPCAWRHPRRRGRAPTSYRRVVVPRAQVVSRGRETRPGPVAD